MRIANQHPLVNGRKIFFISDTHFFHTNIIKEEYCGRPFKNIEEMNQSMFDGWNQKVGPDDLVIHLGDIAMHGWSGFLNSINSLNGKILLVKGNHDPENLSFILDEHSPSHKKIIRTNAAIKLNVSLDKCKDAGIVLDERTGLLSVDEHAFLAANSFGLPVPPLEDCKVIAVDYLELSGFGISSQPVVCSHYPFESWKGSSKGDKAAVHLHGHCHGRLTTGRHNRLDVSCDNIYRLFPKKGKDAFLPLTTKELLACLQESNNRII